MQHRARIRRAAERPQHRRNDPPAPTVAPPPDTGGPSAVAADFSIATLSVLPEVTPVARKIQRQENDDRHPAPAPTPAPPATPPGDDAEQLKAGGEGSTTLLAPTVSFKVYSGKTLQDVSNALPKEAGSFTFDIATATDGDPITRATVTVKQAIELPRWAERDVQCRPIQAAWDRFASALRQHEDEHVKINKQQLGTAHTHYVGKAKSETPDVTSELENDANAAGQAFDAQTGNGTTGNPPTIIDVGAKCSDKGTFEDFAPNGEELQAKLEVSEPGDPDEEEADRVAEQVMRMADPRERAPLRLVSGGGVVQRCAACEAEEKKWQAASEDQRAGRVRRKCAECEANEKAVDEEELKKQRVARKEANGRSSVSGSARVVDVTRSGGQPLDAETRTFMEPRFGYDFSRVRIHADNEAAIAARLVSARAYTLGSNVVFASGQYAPMSVEGRRLLAHELTHVVQQHGASGQVHRAPTPATTDETPVQKAIRTQDPADARAINEQPAAEAAWRMTAGDKKKTPATAPALQRMVLMRQPDGGAPTADPKDAGASSTDANYVTLEGKKLARYPEQQRRDIEEIVAKKGRAGPRDFLDEWELIYDRAKPLAGVSDNQSEIEHAREALDSLRGVVKQLETDINTFLDEFESEGRIVLGDTLTDSETRAKAEGIKYGLTEKQIEESTTEPETGQTATTTWTSYDFRDPNAPAVSGVAEAAKQLLQRRSTKIDPVKKKLEDFNMSRARSASPAGGYVPAKTAENVAAEKELVEEERSYDVLANDMAQRYPIIGSFTRDKDDLRGLQTLAAGGTHDAAQLIGVKIAETLGKIKKVRDENTPGGDANPYKIPKIVALTKGRKSVAENSWQNKVVDEHIADIHHESAVIGIAIGLMQLALVLLAPATGGASLVVAAGLSTAVAVEHAKEYMLEEAMAGSDVDKARALSQDEPSLFWLAVDIVAAVADIGAGAAAVAKLINTWRTAASAVRAVNAAKTADELAAARKAMAEALEHEPELLARITKSIDKDGRLAKVSEEVKAVEAAVDKAAQAELKAAITSDAGHVHVTETGRVFSCHSPCTEMRAKYSELLATEESKGLLGDLTKLEEDSAKAVSEGKKGAELKPLAERAEALDAALAKAMTQARAKKIASWLETMPYPALKEHPLDLAAVERIIQKTNPDHIKGQLLEELMGSKLQNMIASGDKGLEALAGGRPIEKLEYIGGHRVKDAGGRQFTDGMLIIRDGDKVEVVAVIESKAGKAASKGLAGEYTSLRSDGTYKSLKELGAERPVKELTDAERELIEARRHAIEGLVDANPKKYKGLTIEAIDQLAEHQADIAKAMDGLVKTEAGQAVNDIERMVSVGFKIDDEPVKLAKGGRGSTKVVGVLPDDVPGKALEAKIGAGTKEKPGQGINFTTQNVGIDSKELNSLAGEIATRAAAPAL
ncbi:MAG TPA: DUF4157 domain-containing protein [Vicinamibacterales bacterium]|nr:DUF4157 domain-containing protein [Vicinamibacterales bacterium]